MIDITNPEHIVEVEFDEVHRVLWVNVDGACVLRICKIGKNKLKFKLPMEDMSTSWNWIDSNR